MQTEKEPTQQDYVIELLEELGCVPLRFAPHIVFAKQDNPPKSKKLLEVKFDGDLMRHWLMIARHPFLGKGCPKWRARKNFWALVRKYRTLAEQHNLRETDVF
jgi:hypothetical protein